MTHRRVVAVVISVWVWCPCISLFALNSVLENVLAIITATFGAVCLTTTGLIYCKIILNRTSPHKSDSRLAIATRRTESEWKIGKCCKTEKNCTCYISRVCGVCGLFFAVHVR